VSNSLTVVINAAGLGTRLGLNCPKSIVEINGKPILGWQLDLLEDVDVVVVAGFLAGSIVDYLRQSRPDVPVVLNHDFRSTGTAASLALGARIADDWVVSLDGDLLVAPDSMSAFLKERTRLVGLTKLASDSPVGVELDVDTGDVTRMDFEIDSDMEWSGLLRFPRDEVRRFGTGHVFESLLSHMPLPSREVDCVEIDEPDDLERASLWLADHTENGKWKLGDW
jgi:choline kinase